MILALLSAQAKKCGARMLEQSPVVIRTGDGARASMVELGAWAARLEAIVRQFVEDRSLPMPPVVYRFSHPVRRALPRRRIGIKLWEAYPPACSESGVWEIHIHPRETDPRTIVVAALRGMASAIAGPDVKFGADYGLAAARLGLAPGPSGRRRGGVSWRNAVIGQRSSAVIDSLADRLGAFPLGALDASKAQRWYPDRNFRNAICPTCGPTNARLSRKGFEERIFMCAGARIAPHVPAIVMLGRDDDAKSEAAWFLAASHAN